MRIALVSPYSWTYPGGVTSHIEALAGQFTAAGHDVRVLAPVDPDDRLAARLHRGARPQARALPEWLVPLGRTVGYPLNGAVSNLAGSPLTHTRLRSALAAGRFDVVHVHEPMAPIVGWDAVMGHDLPLVGTFHAYATNPFSNGIGNLAGARRRFNRLHVRIAVSEAAAWTGRRFFGGRYRVIPNGVHLVGAPPDAGGAWRPPAGPGRRPAAPAVVPLRIVFVGQAVERKGLSVLLRAFEALREHVPATLTVIGADAKEVGPLLLDPRGVRTLGKVTDAEKHARLREADVLCAPSLRGESFGMVLTEAFAAGTPVVASAIPGYAGVVRHGEDGLLVGAGDATALARALRELALDPRRRAAMGAAALRGAERYAWPRVAGEVLEAYADARAVLAPTSALRRVATRHGLVPADGLAPVAPRRLPALEAPAPESGPARPGPDEPHGFPAPAGRQRAGALPGALRRARSAALGLAGLAIVLLALVALRRVGVDRIAASLLASSPAWVLAGLGVMCASMFLRAEAWYAILRAALPGTLVRRADALQGTFIGVLMSATLPARLGEPSRAFIVARRLGRARDHLPTVLGSIVSQTLLNVLALAILGLAVVSSLDLFARSRALVLVTLLPVVVVAAVLVAPALSRAGGAGARRAVVRLRDGLRVFRQPRLGARAVAAQLTAWALQWLSCYLLLAALGLDDRAGLGAAAAVLFAVNVTAIVPATPSNLGVFQAACVAVLGAYGVGAADALAYGIILQAVEIATAVVMGAPALVKEGVSWREVRLRALHGDPVQLPPVSPPVLGG